jgi:sporulation protein YunB
MFSVSAAPTILKYAEAQTRKMATLIINKAVSRHLLEHLDQSSLTVVEYDSEGRIMSVTFDTLQLNQLLTKTTNIVQLNIKSLEQGQVDKVEYSDLGIDIPPELLKRGIVYEIPFGITTNNVWLSSLGPKIPVKFQLVGDVTTGVKSSVKEWGINNVLVELSIQINVSTQVVIPLASTMTTVTNHTPVAVKILQGKVPDFFLGTRDILDNSVTIIFDNSEGI